MCVVRWALASLSMIGRDPRPPVLPLLGEIYRARFSHPEHGSATPPSYVFFVAEQTSAEPPTAVMYGNNCRCGWEVSGSFIVRQRFFG